MLLEGARWYFLRIALPLAKFFSHVQNTCFADLRPSMVPVTSPPGPRKLPIPLIESKLFHDRGIDFAGDSACNTQIDE